MTASNQRCGASSMSFQKNDPPDYSISGESTHGALVIRREPLMKSKLAQGRSRVHSAKAHVAGVPPQLGTPGNR